MPQDIHRRICIVEKLLPAILLLFLAACNRNSASSLQSMRTSAASRGSSLPDACKLLTRAEAESILGEPISNPKPNDPNDPKGYFVTGKTCTYQTTVGLGFDYISIQLEDLETGSSWEAVRKEPAAGLGDDAFWSGPGVGLHIRTKQGWMTILCVKLAEKGDIDDKAIKALHMAVAQKALPRFQ